MDKIKEFFKKNFKDIFKPIIVLLAICIVIPLALSVTNRFTKEKIANLESKNQSETMKLLIDAEAFNEYHFGDDESSEDYFSYFIAEKGGKPVGYIFKTSAKGYGGDVKVMTAILPDGKVKEVAILDVSNETPGLGQNASKENFYSQFKDKTLGVEVLKNNADESKNQINAVTGATITSRAVTSAVNRACENFKLISETEAKTSEK